MSTSERHFLDFNKYAKEFLYKMNECFPNEIKIKLYISLFLLKEKMDIEEPVRLFINSVKDYGIQIMSKDEMYFKKETYINKAESLSSTIGLVDKWENMSVETKENIWKYLQLLYSLSMIAMGYNEELNEIIKKSKLK